MDISILKQVFPEDQFIITGDNQMVTIKTKGESEYLCAKISITYGQGDETLKIIALSACGIKGSKTLEKIEEFARKAGFKKITLGDASYIEICSLPINLAILKILTKGESWYNSLGYKSTNYDNEKKNNEALIKKSLKDFFSGPSFYTKNIKSEIISLLKRDDLTEEELENHSLQSITKMILNLASDCKNADAANVLHKLITYIVTLTFMVRDSENPIIDYNNTLEKTLVNVQQSERGAKKMSRILSKGSKRGGRKRSNRRKKSLKRKRL